MITTLLLILALTAFILAAFGVPRANWIAVGLALFILTLLLPRLGVGS